MMPRLLILLLFFTKRSDAFSPQIQPFLDTKNVKPRHPTLLHLDQDKSDKDDTKFGFGARIESAKCVAVGALSGGIALAPVSLVKDLALSDQSLAQWEFDTDTGSLEAALFAIVYRYCIREDTNPQLKQGVVGAFLLTRTLARIQIPSYCSAAPLNCKYMLTGRLGGVI